jgi:hypothetical protein
MTFVQSLELGLDFTPLLAQSCTAAVCDIYSCWSTQPCWKFSSYTSIVWYQRGFKNWPCTAIYASIFLIMTSMSFIFLRSGFAISHSAPNSKSAYWKYALQVIPYDLFLYCSGNSDNCIEYFSNNYHEHGEHGQEVRWLRILRIGCKGYSLKLHL